jgi:hypothetical protein
MFLSSSPRNRELQLCSSRWQNACKIAQPILPWRPHEPEAEPDLSGQAVPAGGGFLLVRRVRVYDVGH